MKMDMRAILLMRIKKDLRICYYSKNYLKTVTNMKVITSLVIALFYTVAQTYYYTETKTLEES